jgi:hypothetical protein
MSDFGFLPTTAELRIFANTAAKSRSDSSKTTFQYKYRHAAIAKPE